MPKYPRHPKKKYIAFKSNDLKDALCALNPLIKYIRENKDYVSPF